MSESEDAAATEQLRQRVLRLEYEAGERAISDAYARFYAPLAIMAVLLSTMPLYKSFQVSEGVHRTFESTWEMAGNIGGEPAVLGLFLLAGLVTVMCVAAVRTKSAALPISIAVLATLVVGMILLKPGTGTPKPGLTNLAVVGVAFTVVIIALAIAHAVHLFSRARRNAELYRTAATDGASSESAQ